MTVTMWHPLVSEIPMAYFQTVKIIMAYFHLTLRKKAMRFFVCLWIVGHEQNDVTDDKGWEGG
jgi:hypothetical protein